MPSRIAKFASLPIGPSLSVTGGGYELQTTNAGADLNRVVRSDFVQTTGEHGCEFIFDGQETGPSACIGICRPSASLGTQLGNTADGIGWRLDVGQLRINNAIVASGLPVIGKKQLVGLLLVLTSTSTARLELYSGRDVIYTHVLGALNDWHFAVSLAAANAGGMKAYVNAGQWPLVSAISRTGGWDAAESVVATKRFSDLHFMSGSADSPAYTRWEGDIEQSGIEIVEELNFWPWGKNTSRTASAGQVKITDADGALDVFATQNLQGKLVRVRAHNDGQSLNAATDYGWFAIDRVEIVDDTIKQFTLRDAHADLDEPLLRTVFLPFMSAQEAWSPVPLVIGACASVPAYPINSDGSLAFICDSPLAGISRVTEGGDDLLVNTDWTLDLSRQQLQLISPPIKSVLCDASSIGRIEPLPGHDAWLSVANPFTGTNGLTPAGMTANSAGGMGSPQFQNAAYVGGTLGGAGKPPYTSGAVFPNGTNGAFSWLSRTALTVSPGGSVRYQIQAVANTKLLLSWSSAPRDAFATIQNSGYFEGTITNPYASAKSIYLIAIGDGAGGNAAVVTSAVFYTLEQFGVDLLPAKIERAVSEVMGRCRKSNWKNEDLAIIDEDTGYAGIGYWTRERSANARSVLPELLDSYTAAGYAALDGQLRFARLTDPASLNVALSLTINDFHKAPVILPDDALGLSTRMAYRPNFAPMSSSEFVSDLLDVPVSRRNELTAKHRGIVYSKVTLAEKYRLAEFREPSESYFWQQIDAQAELDRVCSLYSVDRNFYHVTIKSDRRLSVVLGQGIGLTYPRYDLSAGKTLMLVGRRTNPISGDHLLTLWG